ncbi:hypothetical protein Hanom_Chr02g00100711 [Helianthus anomalus]
MFKYLSRDFLAVSNENVNAVVGRSMNHSPCEVLQRRCGDGDGSFNCSVRAVEPRTSIEFPHFRSKTNPDVMTIDIRYSCYKDLAKKSFFRFFNLSAQGLLFLILIVFFRHAWGLQIDLRDAHFLAFASENQFLEPDYDDYGALLVTRDLGMLPEGS